MTVVGPASASRPRSRSERFSARMRRPGAAQAQADGDGEQTAPPGQVDGRRARGRERDGADGLRRLRRQRVCAGHGGLDAARPGARQALGDAREPPGPGGRHGRPRRRLGAGQRPRQGPGQARAHRVGHGPRARGLDEGLDDLAQRLPLHRDLAHRRRGPQPQGDRVELGRGGAGRVGLPRDPVDEYAPHGVEIVPPHRRDRQDGDPGQAVGHEEVAHVLQQAVPAPHGQGVDLVDQDEHVLLAGAQSAQVAVVQGRVGVLLRIDHPHEDVRQRNETIHL